MSFNYDSAVKYIFSADGRQMTIDYKHMTNDEVVLKLDGVEFVRTTTKALKEMIQPLKLKKATFEWNAYFSVNQ